MLEEIAEVVEVHPGHQLVSSSRLSASQSCQASRDCGQRKLAGLFGNKQVIVRIENPDRWPIETGQSVVIGLHEGALLRSSLLLYLFPLLLMMLVALPVSYFTGTEGMVILSGLLGLLLGFWLARIFSVQLLSNPKYYPVLLKAHH